MLKKILVCLSFVSILGYTSYANMEGYSIMKKFGNLEVTEEKIEQIKLTKSKTKIKKEVFNLEKLDSNIKTEEDIKRLYSDLGLEGKLSYDAFEKGVKGYQTIDKKRRAVLTIADFSKISTEERLVVIDMAKKKIIYSTFVTHGKNSGEMMATKFSNIVDSYQSSPGFYLTKSTYMGSNGYSLKLDGLEKGINDNAMKRNIVVHGSDYIGNNIAGKSLGCPAVPRKLSKPLIDKIKNETVFYIHTNQKFYIEKSKYAKL